jgi:hypothetical protein
MVSELKKKKRAWRRLRPQQRCARSWRKRKRYEEGHNNDRWASSSWLTNLFISCSNNPELHKSRWRICSSSSTCSSFWILGLRTQYDACCHISSKIDLVSGLRCILPHICAGELPCCHNLCVLSSRVPTSPCHHLWMQASPELSAVVDSWLFSIELCVFSLCRFEFLQPMFKALIDEGALLHEASFFCPLFPVW